MREEEPTSHYWVLKYILEMGLGNFKFGLIPRLLYGKREKNRVIK